jgi:hypothetical protein
MPSTKSARKPAKRKAAPAKKAGPARKIAPAKKKAGPAKKAGLARKAGMARKAGPAKKKARRGSLAKKRDQTACCKCANIQRAAGNRLP